MKYSEIQNLQIQELRKRLYQNRNELFEARMKHKMQRLSNVMTIQYLRRDMARLQTALSVLQEKEEVPTGTVKKVNTIKPAKTSSEKKPKQTVSRHRIEKKQTAKTKMKKPDLKKVKAEKSKKIQTISVPSKSVSEPVKKKKTGWFSFVNRFKRSKSTKPSGD